MVRVSRIPIVNPPGFFIRLIESNMSVPASFETSAKSKAREDSERKERERHQAFSDEMIETIAQNEAKREIRKQVSLLTFEEFVDRKQHDPDFFLKLVAVSPGAEPETVSTDLPTDMPVMTDDVVVPQETAITDEPLIMPLDPPVMAEERAEAIQPAPEAATQAEISEPAVELVSEPPREEPGGNAAEQGMV
jgi:hypothetical protein